MWFPKLIDRKFCLRACIVWYLCYPNVLGTFLTLTIERLHMVCMPTFPKIDYLEHDVMEYIFRGYAEHVNTHTYLETRVVLRNVTRKITND